MQIYQKICEENLEGDDFEQMLIEKFLPACI
jgi:hypothetical protein